MFQPSISFSGSVRRTAHVQEKGRCYPARSLTSWKPIPFTRTVHADIAPPVFRFTITWKMTFVIRLPWPMQTSDALWKMSKALLCRTQLDISLERLKTCFQDRGDWFEVWDVLVNIWSRICKKLRPLSRARYVMTNCYLLSDRTKGPVFVFVIHFLLHIWQFLPVYARRRVR